jgi:RNA polymerase sigma-70 factor (ECF subfamily)
MSDAPLTQLFLPHLPSEARERIAGSERLELALQDALEVARAAWPNIPLLSEVFLPYLAQRVPVDKDPERALLKLRVADLYLTCACLEGVPQAVEILETEYLPKTRAVLARMETPSVAVEDVQQMLCQKLLTCSGTAVAPKLAQYSGTGDLQSWLSVIAVRCALDVLRKEKDTAQLDDITLADAMSPEEDQELQYLKSMYRSEFKTAFQQALAALSTRERNILRHQMLDGLTLDQIAAIYNVHRATIARWNARLREKLLTQTRKTLLRRLNTSRTEFESIMRLIQSHFDVSIRRHLTRSDD